MAGFVASAGCDTVHIANTVGAAPVGTIAMRTRDLLQYILRYNHAFTYSNQVADVIIRHAGVGEDLLT